jgi:hypothetical protein
LLPTAVRAKVRAWRRSTAQSIGGRGAGTPGRWRGTCTRRATAAAAAANASRASQRCPRLMRRQPRPRGPDRAARPFPAADRLPALPCHHPLRAMRPLPRALADGIPGRPHGRHAIGPTGHQEAAPSRSWPLAAQPITAQPAVFQPALGELIPDCLPAGDAPGGAPSRAPGYSASSEHVMPPGSRYAQGSWRAGCGRRFQVVQFLRLLSRD